MLDRGLKRWGGALALFAYCFQLLVSFGHIHADEVYGPLGHAIQIGVGTEHVTAPPLHGSTAPDQADSSEACAICAVVHLAASGVLPNAASLPIPAVGGDPVLGNSEKLLLASRRYLLSHTRAPPSLSI